MTRRITYVDGLNEVVASWTTGVFEWALVTTAWAPNESIEFFADNFAPFEFTDASYGRVTMTTPSVSIFHPVFDGSGGYISYLCDPPDFGIVSGGEIAVWLVLYNFQTNDADSPIVAVYPAGYTADGVLQALFSLGSQGAVAVSTVCPSGF